MCGSKTLSTVLQRPDVLLADVLAGRDLGWHWARLALLMAACAAMYGAVLGHWQGARLSLYVALKLPLVLFSTSALTVLFHWIASALLGLPLRFKQVAVLTFLGLAAGSVLLASLAPVAWLFTVSAPEPSATARTAHNLLYLMHTCIVAASGLAGTGMLWRALRQTGRPEPTLRGVYLLWVLSYALVGGEVAWALRPFVGSVYHPIVFLRDDALHGNVYEFILTDIVPHLLSRLDD